MREAIQTVSLWERKLFIRGHSPVAFVSGRITGKCLTMVCIGKRFWACMARKTKGTLKGKSCTPCWSSQRGS